MARILWVEDRSHWISKFQPVLEGCDLGQAKNQVEVFKFAEAAKQHIALAGEDERPDIAVLDAHLNGNSAAGFSVSTALQRKWPGVPVIYLSEHSGTDIEKDALEQYSADDFIAKHQRNVEEVLCWRVKAVMRQQAVRDSSPALLPGDMLVRGEIKMDLTRWETYWRGVKLMNPDNPKRPLPPMPRKILRALIEHSPRPLSASRIAELFDIDPERFSNVTYRQHIKTLRRSFDQAEGKTGRFMQACKNGMGIVAFGEEGAYSWVDHV